jgi:hypothetical protein
MEVPHSTTIGILLRGPLGALNHFLPLVTMSDDLSSAHMVLMIQRNVRVASFFVFSIFDSMTTYSQKIVLVSIGT